MTRSRLMLAAVAIVTTSFLVAEVVDARGISRGGGGGRGGGGISRGGGGGRSFGGGGGRTPSMSRPSSRPSVSRPSSRPNISRPSSRPSMPSRPSGGSRPSFNVPSRPSGGSSRPSIGGGSRPSIGGGNRPSTLPGGSRPSIGGGNRPSIGGGNRPSIGGGNRPTTRPGGDRPNLGRPDFGNRPNLGGGNRPSLPSGRPSPGDLGDFLDLPGGRPGGGNRPTPLPERPGGGDRPGVLPERPGGGDRPGRPGGGDRPGILPERPGGGDRPGRPGGGDRPGILPERPGGGDRPGRPGDRPGRPGDRPNLGDLPNLGGDRPNLGRPDFGNRPNLNDRLRPGRGDINIGSGNTFINNRQNNYNSIRNRWTNVNNRPFNRGWWGRYPTNLPAWRWHNGWRRYPSGWCWRHAGWAGLGSWFVWSAWSQPVVYEYGTNVVYRDNYVYINEEQVATTTEYYNQADTIAESVPASADPEKIEWMPLGVFAIAEEGGTDTGMLLQLAVSKDGIIAGTFYNDSTDAGRPVQGMVDKDSQRAAWKFADGGKNEDLVMETAVYNLTEDDTTALVHFGDEKTETWLMVRLPEEDEEKE